MEETSGYRQTEVGVIPEDWEVSSIESVLSEISMGPFGSDITVSNFVSEGVPVLSGANVSSERLRDSFVNFVSPAKAKSLKRAVARRGDVVVTHRGTLGQISYIPEDSAFDRYVISQSQFRVRFIEDLVSPYWIVRYFHSARGAESLLEGRGHTGVPAIAQPTKTFRQLRVPRPPLPEQRVIVGALSDVDALLAGLDRLIAKKRDLKQAAMQRLLTGETRLPGFHGAWEIKRFENVLERLNTKAHQIQTSDYQSTGKYPVVDQGKEPVVGFSDEERKRFRCPDGGVIVFGDHTCIIKFVDFDFVVGADGTQILHATAGQNTRFHAFQLEYRAVNPTGYNRHFRFLKERDFLVPTCPEQDAISALLSDMDSEIAGLEARRDKTRALKQAMMQELLTGRTRLVPIASANA